MEPWRMATAVGGVAISVISLFCGLFLLASLWRNGRGKVRVRLLMGIVSSDILISLTALPTEALFLSGNAIATGSTSCDAQAFFFTSAVFAQNLWTLCIAVATFCLLKLPMHPFTTALEKYAWTTWPAVWALSFLHSGIWLATVGFANTSTMCTYASRHHHQLDRDLVQFVPRAFVFVVLFALYSRLFSFLRRPDTINLSSNKYTTSVSSFSQGTVSAVQGAGRKLRRVSKGCVCADRGHEDVDPAAPWEALEFCKVDQYRDKGSRFGTGLGASAPPSPSTSFFSPTTSDGRRASRPLSPPPPPSQPMSRTTPPVGTQLPTISPATELAPASVSATTTRVGSEPTTPTTLINTPTIDPRKGSVGAIVWSEKYFEPRGSVGSVTFSDDLDKDRNRTPRRLGRPSLSAASGQGETITFGDPFKQQDGKHGLGIEPVEPKDPFSTASTRDIEPASDAPAYKPSHPLDDSDSDDDGPTLTDFLRANAVDTGTASDARPTESATAYFNRQASLLMLWFPLAYMFNFSITLVRLVYDMSSSTPSPALALLSSWMTLSVGLFDALVFGLAEYVVRRRVRRMMPHQLRSTTEA